MIAPDGVPNDQFGQGLAIREDIIAVRTPAAIINTRTWQGAVYIFGRNQGGEQNWGLTKKAVATGGAQDDMLGDDGVAIYGDTVVAGAPNATVGTTWQGTAFAFSRNQGGADQWGQIGKLTAADGQNGDEFGRAVALNADTIAVAADFADIGSNSDQGAAYVYVQQYAIYLPLILK